MANSHMLVYSPVTESSFMSRRLPDAKVNVSCSFSGDKRVFYRVLFLVYCYKECSRYQMWSSHGASLICLRIKWQLKWILTANVMRWHSIRKCGSNIYCLKSRWQSIKWWNTKNYLQRQLLAVKLRYLELIILSGWDDLKFLALLFFIRYFIQQGGSQLWPAPGGWGAQEAAQFGVRHDAAQFRQHTTQLYTF